VLKTLLNKHAPKRYKSASQKPSAPWMNLKIEKRHRHLERVWCKSHSPSNRSCYAYTKQCHHCNRQITKAKSIYYANMVSN